jgi:predicted DNA-binding transcriptional regulator YafY
MKKTSTKDRFDRLEKLKARLRSGDPTTLAEVSAELGVSTRTLIRDVNLLREQGLPIETDRGRGGGIRLHHSWGIGRINLNYSEAVDLLVGLAVAEQIQSPLFMAHLNVVRRKLMASFSPALGYKIKGLKARILVGKPVSAALLSAAAMPKRSVVEALHQAFLLLNTMTVTYCSVDGKKTQRSIQPHYLLLCNPIWYVVAWDDLRSDVRTFRCDRITSARCNSDNFKLLPISRFEKSLEGIEAI